MNECKEPESKSTTAGCWLMENIPEVTGSPSGMSSTIV
jgi:hypothetical protein